MNQSIKYSFIEYNPDNPSRRLCTHLLNSAQCRRKQYL